MTTEIFNTWLCYYQHGNISDIALKVTCLITFITKCTCRLETLSWSRGSKT